MATLESTGKLTFLRVSNVGDNFGPSGDSIQAEVVCKLDTLPNNAFGFKLHNDDNRPTRTGMLDLLRDAFNHDWTVSIDYDIDAGKHNGYLVRVALRK